MILFLLRLAVQFTKIVVPWLVGTPGCEVVFFVVAEITMDNIHILLQ